MKKTGLFKIIMFILLGIVIATWLFSGSYFYSGTFTELGMKNIGFFDYFSLLFGALEFEYFLQSLILLLSIGALYGVLIKTGKYRELVERIAKNLKGKEFVVLIVISFLIALLTAVFEYGFIAFIFVPFIISILLAIGYDKTTVFIAVFGSMLVGTFGSLLGTNTVGVTAELLETDNEAGLIYKFALFIFAFCAELVFLMKNKKVKAVKLDEKEDLYLGEKVDSHRTIKPIVTVLIILGVLMLLACTSWNNMLHIDFFESIHTAITGLTIKLPYFHLTNNGVDAGLQEVAIFSKLFGEISAFGNWYYAEMSVVCLLAALLLGKMYKLHTVDAMAEGVKKILKPAMMVMLVYIVIYFVGMQMFFPTVANLILGLTKEFNVLTSYIVTVIGSVLHVDILYIANYVAPQLLAQEGANASTLAVMTQSVYGATMFIAPTSVFLVFGLTYLEIPYKEYVKKVWKLVVALFVIALIVAFLINSFGDVDSLTTSTAIGVITCLLIVVLMYACYWRLFKKAGKPGWAAIVPIYNVIVMLQINGEPIWHIVLFLIPLYNIYYLFKFYITFAKKYGASTAFGVFMAINPFSYIFTPVLAFGNYKYKK